MRPVRIPLGRSPRILRAPQPCCCPPSSPLLQRLRVIERHSLGNGASLVVLSRTQQSRSQSTKRDANPPPPRRDPVKERLDALWDSFKHPGRAFRGVTLGKLFRQNPGELVFAIVA